MIRPDGYVKVLDFGLARLEEVQTATADDVTRSYQVTTPGTILGTSAYMSPEQAKAGTDRTTLRRVRAGDRALRDGSRYPAVQGRDDGRRARRDHLRATGLADATEPGCTLAARCARPADARERAGSPPIGARSRSRARVDSTAGGRSRAGAGSGCAAEDCRARSGTGHPPARACPREGRSQPASGGLGRSRHRQDQSGRRLSRRVDDRFRTPDRDAGPLFGTTGGRRGLSADSRSARPPSPSPKRGPRRSHRHEDRGSYLVRASGHRFEPTA